MTKRVLRENYEKTEFTQSFDKTLQYLTRLNIAEVLMGLSKGIPQHFVMLIKKDEPKKETDES